MNYKSILFFLGIYSLLVSLFSILNILYSIYFDFIIDLNSYLITFFISLIAGFSFYYVGRNHSKDITLTDQIIFIVLSFILIPFLISIPYVLSVYDIDFLDSYFGNPNNDPILKGFDIGTLATNLSIEEESNINITKVKINGVEEKSLGIAKDFYKNSKGYIDHVYHHVGIYSFSIATLRKFVSMSPSVNELNYHLEQWRALDSGLSIGVSFVENVPMSVDTKEDLIHLESIIKSQ